MSVKPGEPQGVEGLGPNLRAGVVQTGHHVGDGPVVQEVVEDAGADDPHPGVGVLEAPPEHPVVPGAVGPQLPGDEAGEVLDRESFEELLLAEADQLGGEGWDLLRRSPTPRTGRHEIVSLPSFRHYRQARVDDRLNQPISAESGSPTPEPGSTPKDARHTES